MTLNLIDLLVSKNACSLIKLLISGLKRVPCDSSCSSGSKIWLLWDFVLFQFLKVVICGRKIDSKNIDKDCYLHFWFRNEPPEPLHVFNGVRIAHSFAIYVVFCPISFSHCIFYPSSYSFRLPLWYLPTFLNKTSRTPTVCCPFFKILGHCGKWTWPWHKL